MSWRFLTDCAHSDGPSINAMTAAARPVSFRTMSRVLGDAFVEKQKELGYDVGRERGGLRMSKDWAVSYAKSVYRGQPCYYFRWSAIEHIFVQARAITGGR